MPLGVVLNFRTVVSSGMLGPRFRPLDWALIQLCLSAVSSSIAVRHHWHQISISPSSSSPLSSGFFAIISVYWCSIVGAEGSGSMSGGSASAPLDGGDIPVSGGPGGRLGLVTTSISWVSIAWVFFLSLLAERDLIFLIISAILSVFSFCLSRLIQMV